jgi:hypothetical protein
MHYNRNIFTVVFFNWSKVAPPSGSEVNNGPLTSHNKCSKSLAQHHPQFPVEPRVVEQRQKRRKHALLQNLAGKRARAFVVVIVRLLLVHIVRLLSTLQEQRHNYSYFGLMVRGLSYRPNLPEGPAAMWDYRRFIKKEEA